MLCLCSRVCLLPKSQTKRHTLMKAFREQSFDVHLQLMNVCNRSNSRGLLNKTKHKNGYVSFIAAGLTLGVIGSEIEPINSDTYL